MTTRRNALLALLIGLGFPGAMALVGCFRGEDMKEAAAAYCAPPEDPRERVRAGALPLNARRACALWGFR